MSRIKKIMWGLLLVFMAIQLFRPAHNKTDQVLPTDFAKVFVVPNNVRSVFQTACYDCHSNNTTYPWYSNIQPVGWLMARHIKKGKEKLNFSDFGTYTSRRQVSRLKGIANQIKDDEMPLTSYRWMHKNARLSIDQKALMMDWINKTADSLSGN